MAAMAEKSKRSNRFSSSVGMKIAGWNVRTLLDNELTERTYRQTDLLVRELSRYDTDIATLSETSLDGQFTETTFGYIFFWKGEVC